MPRQRCCVDKLARQGAGHRDAPHPHQRGWTSGRPQKPGQPRDVHGSARKQHSSAPTAKNHAAHFLEKGSCRSANILTASTCGPTGHMCGGGNLTGTNARGNTSSQIYSRASRVVANCRQSVDQPEALPSFIRKRTPEVVSHK